MKNQPSAGVIHVLVQGIVGQVGGLKKALLASRFTQPKLELEWDDTQYSNDKTLAKDQSMLRDLEAEIYALTDQFNTEQGIDGAAAL